MRDIFASHTAGIGKGIGTPYVADQTFTAFIAQEMLIMRISFKEQAGEQWDLEYDACDQKQAIKV